MTDSWIDTIRRDVARAREARRARWRTTEAESRGAEIAPACTKEAAHAPR